MGRLLLSLFILLLFNVILTSQNRTVGTLRYNEEALDGYTFFSPFAGRSAYMVDNCGNLINQWEQGSLPGLAAYFLETGEMLRTYKVDPLGPFISASNAGGVALVDWNNMTNWSYELNTATELSHHDGIMLPNGNVLLLTWELITSDELIEKGRDPNEIAVQGFAWGERIVELKPIGNTEVEIVWEWRIKDHWIQDRDPALSNFGVIEEHPELFNINLPDINSNNSHSDFDYNHFNSIDYHPEYEQILISVRNSDEIWILDHSTTTEEAATHTGGRSGMGGDILYRWGNPSAYEAAGVGAQRLFGQHGANWITDGPDKNKILIYNNGNGRPGTDFSTVEILDPPLLTDGTYEKNVNAPFGPTATEWVYGDELDQRFYSPFLSNAQCLANGHVLINAGSLGNIFEINENKEIVWEYEIPLFGDFVATQGDNINSNSTFRAYKFPLDFVGFEGLDIVVGSPIEEDPIPLEICELLNSINGNLISPAVHVFQVANQLFIRNESGNTYQVDLIDINGKLLNTFISDPGDLYKPMLRRAAGLYFLRFIAPDGSKFIKKVFL